MANKLSQEKAIFEINTKMTVLIGLLLKLINTDSKCLSLRQQIEMLDGLGVGPTEIGRIINHSATYVSKELAGIRKSKNQNITSI